MASDSKSSRFLSSGEVQEIFASIVLGWVAPLLDSILGSNTKSYLTIGISAFEGTHMLLGWRLSGAFPSLEASIFNILAIWHALLLVQPIWQHIRGGETDIRFYRNTAQVEWRLFFYFGPTASGYVLGLLWSIRVAIVAALAVLAGVWWMFLKPMNLLALKAIVIIAKGFNRTDFFTIRGLFMQAYEVLTCPFDRWEIAAARRFRDHRDSPLSAYEYTSLKDKPRYIRLLRLKRRFFRSEPACELIDVSIDDSRPFEAISYTWGTKDPSIPLLVNGQRVLVTSAIEELLFHRRTIFGTKLFWIDAICINQSDTDEKDNQLRLMGEIYKRASRVVIWLGPPESLQETRDTRKLIRALNWPKFGNVSSGTLLPTLFNSEEEAFVALGKLFSHPWFERIWVVQEVVLGRTVHVMYHGVCVEWDMLVNAANAIYSDPDVGSRLKYHLAEKTTSTTSSDPGLGHASPINMTADLHYHNAISMERIRELVQTGKSPSLATILIWVSSFKSKDVRDKIFAICDITSDGSMLPFERSYKDSADIVFINTTAHMLSSKEWFYVLAFTGLGYERIQQMPQEHLVDPLPSWVPDYSSPVLPTFRRVLADNVRKRDEAGKATTFANNPRIIKIEAIEFDRIRLLGPKSQPQLSSILVPNDKSPGDVLKHQVIQFFKASQASARNWYLESRKLARAYSNTGPKSRETRETADQTFWELCMSEGPTTAYAEAPPPIYPVLSRSSRKIFEHFLLVDPSEWWNTSGESITNGKATTMDVLKLQMRLVSQFGTTAAGKRLAVTANGSMALVPPLTEDGDTLVHVRGGVIPLLLRQRVLGVRRAELVGTCSVHGVEDVYSGIGWEDWLLE